jgi:hypothetical protein
MSTPLQRTCLAIALAAPSCCVAATTRVRTPRGDVPAGALEIGDQVLSLDITTGQLSTATIVEIRRATRECLALHHAGGALVCTPDHPIYCPESRTYRPASDWITGDAHTLLRVTADTHRPTTVTSCDTFAGVHEVLDLTLDAEPHNFLAADILVHNKSPATYFAEGELDGPTIALGGMGGAASFRLFTCVDAVDHPDTRVFVEWTSKSTDVPTDNIPYELSVGFSDALGSGDSVPNDGKAGTTAEKPCSEGVVVTFRRSDPGEGGEIGVSWTARAQVGDFYDEDDADDLDVVLRIEPEPDA